MIIEEPLNSRFALLTGGTQYDFPRIYLKPPVDGEIELYLVWGLPCCGLDIRLECPASFTLGQLQEFIAKAYELREFTRERHFGGCAVPNAKGDDVSGAYQGMTLQAVLARAPD